MKTSEFGSTRQSLGSRLGSIGVVLAAIASAATIAKRLHLPQPAVATVARRGYRTCQRQDETES